MGPVHSNWLLCHDHSCRPLIILGMFLLSRLYEHYCTLQFSSTSKHYNNIPKIKFCSPLYWKKHLHHKILLSTFAELFRLTVCISYSDTTLLYGYNSTSALIGCWAGIIFFYYMATIVRVLCSRFNGSFELWVKLRARGRKQQKRWTKYNYIFNNWKKN